MPFNGSGVFNRNFSWTIDAANTIPITATRVDSDTNDIASGLSNCVTRDGQSPAMADLPMGGFKFTNCANAVLGNQFVTLSQTGTLYLPLAGGTLSGAVTTPNIPFNLIVQQGNSGVMATSTTGLSGLVIRGVGAGNAAFLAFLRDSYGAYFGLDTDNQLKYGGQNVGSVAYRVVHEGLSSVSLAGSLSAQGSVSGGSLSSTSGGVTTSGAGSGLLFNDRTSGFTHALFGAANVITLFSTADTSNNNLVQINATNANATCQGTWTGPNFIGTSDERLKEDIADFVPRDDLAELVRFVSYVRKASGRHELGVIAQQLQKIAPEYVYEGEDGILGVDKAGLALEVAMGLAIRVRDLEGR